jgi:peptidoglycan-N-acetylglucosamine deacetylase
MKVYAGLFLATCLGAQSVAITFDDGPKLAEGVRLGPAQRNAALLKTLAEHKVRAALFVTAANGANRPEGLALARAWGEAGHLLGNHTVTHPDLNAPATTLAAYEQQILDCEGVVGALPGYRKWFRFTFLREGNTPEKRDGIRAFLKEKGYRNAYVSLDTSDWRLDQRLEQVLKQRPDADLEPLRRAYLAHLKQRAEAYRDIARQLLGRDIPQVLLLHHNLINALFLGDVLKQFKDLGWTLVDPEKAYADPVYALQPERPAPGQSLLLSIARSQGVKLAQHDRLVDDGDYEIAELDKVGFK